MTALNCSTWGATHVESCTVFSAQPTIWPRSFTLVAKPLLPPRVGSAVILPNSHLNPTQVWPVCDAGRNAPQLQVSPYGSIFGVSEMPTTSPSLLMPGQTTALFGPPRVPRPNGQLTIHNTACASAS